MKRLDFGQGGRKGHRVTVSLEAGLELAFIRSGAVVAAPLLGAGARGAPVHEVASAFVPPHRNSGEQASCVALRAIRSWATRSPQGPVSYGVWQVGTIFRTN